MMKRRNGWLLAAALASACALTTRMPLAHGPKLPAAEGLAKVTPVRAGATKVDLTIKEMQR